MNNRLSIALLTFAACGSVSLCGQVLFTPGGSLSPITNGTGNVGIGTATPGNRLTVSGGGNASVDLSINGRVQTGDGANNGGVWLNSTQTAFVGMEGNDLMGFYRYPFGWAMSVVSNGNVGIGTTAPWDKLHVQGGGIAVDNPTSEGARVRILNTSKTGATTNDWSIWNMTGPYGNGLSFWRYYANGTNAGPSVWFGDNGNVGIGTTAPTAKLHVSSGDSSFTLFGPNATWNSYMVIGSGTSQVSAGRAQAISTNGNLHLDAGTGQYTYIGYYTPSNTFINPNGGNVGIGTTNPGANKLAVNGTIRAKEVIVDTNWSDYVFASDYTLAPLSEVEAHIKAHHTLPGVPSEAQVAKEGISVGEMQAKLLAKIEELTLHQIEQEKLLANQSQQLAKQSDLVRDQAARLERLEQHSASTTPSTY